MSLEVIVEKFEVLSSHLSGGAEGNQNRLSEDSRYRYRGYAPSDHTSERVTQ
jgi:hypothetical protein